MRIKKNFKFDNKLIALSICMSSTLIGACSNIAVNNNDAISEAESCNSLQSVIEDYPNQFKKYKNQLTIHKGRYNYNSWSADKILPNASECKVWEWGAGLNNYFYAMLNFLNEEGVA